MKLFVMAKGFATLCLQVFALAGHAQASPQKLVDYHHTKWTSADGLGAVREIYQASDGYLWLTSSRGVIRFDGIRFQSVDDATNGAVRNHDVDAVFPSSFGGMWFTTRRRGLLLWKDGKVFDFPDRRCTQGRKPDGIAEDRDGSLWIEASSGLFHLHQGICDELGPETGYPGGFARGILLDSSGTLWVKTNTNQLLYLPRGSRRFSHRPLGDGQITDAAYLHEAPDKSIWIADKRGLRKVWEAHSPISERPTFKRNSGTTELANFLFAKDGSLWAATDRGIERFQNASAQPLGVPLNPANGELFSTKNGLSSNDIFDALTDREGNVWLASDSGLDRLRPNIFTKLRSNYNRNLQAGLAAGEAGSVWLGDFRTPLTHVYADGRSTVFPRTVQVRSIRRDSLGTIWSSGKGEAMLWRVAGSQPESVDYPGQEKDPAAAVTTDRAGGLWVSTFAPDVLHRVKGVWKNENQELGRKPGVLGAMAGDPEGNVWFAFSNKLVEWDGQNFHHYSFPDGPLNISVFTLAIKNGHVWLAGGGGIVLFENGAFEPVLWKDPSLPGSVTGVVETEGGELWLNGFSGAIRVSRSELAQRFKDPTYKLSGQMFDTQDGLPGLAGERYPEPSLVESADGKLWFSTESGMASLNPRSFALAKNEVVPPVSIESLKANGKTFAGDTEVTLAPHTQNVEIAYTALSLSIPERIQFRYKLDGIDRDWQNSGNRRLAFYAHLPVGRHTFRVIACNNDGVWNKAGASIEFTILPTFYQTRLFLIVCLVVVIGVCWFGLRLRMRHLARQIRKSEEVRANERIRIARDLHDTLLQGVQGLTLRFSAAADELPKGSATRQSLEKALISADRLMLEGRNRVSRLRAQKITYENLIDGFRTMAMDFNHAGQVRFEVGLDGSLSTVGSGILGELYYIGQEAITNAFRHSHASQIEVRLEGVAKGVTLTVVDNGRGFNSETYQKAPTADHWGVQGMQERARAIRAEFTCESSVGIGTRVIVTVPARVAYK